MSDVIEVRAGGPLRGRLRVPGDKSISHRVHLFGALADGVSTATGVSSGQDVLGTAAALRALGADIERDGDTVRIQGGIDKLHPVDHPLDLGNSGTTARLILGWLARFGWETTLTGDASLQKRPMDRVRTPLSQMGVTFDGNETLPLTMRGGHLRAIEYTPPVKSAQIKSAILIAGIAADGNTVVHEPVPTRAHTEEMLAEFGAHIASVENNDGSLTISVAASELNPFTHDVATDPSAAAFWMVAASVVPESDVVLENVYVGAGRGGLIEVLVRMGADIEMNHLTGNTADIRVRHSQLHGTDVGDDEIPSLIDELPVLAIAAAMADGPTVVTDAEELRVKESDRINALATEIAGIGIDLEPRHDGFVVHGVPGRMLRGGHVRTHLDHRIGMTAAIGALVAGEPVTIEGWSAVATSYPDFLNDLAKLRNDE